MIFIELHQSGDAFWINVNNIITLKKCDDGGTSVETADKIFEVRESIYEIKNAITHGIRSNEIFIEV